MDGNGEEIPGPANPVKADESKWVEGKKAVMVVSFGTSYADTREASIEATEKAIGAAYPDHQVVRAFTSQIIIDILAKRDNIIVPNPEEAFEQMMADGVEDLIVQPLHIMAGAEYNELMDVARHYESGFKSVTFSKPLLNGIEDYETAALALQSQIPPAMSQDEAIVLMGHGTHHPANATYACFQSVLNKEGMDNVYVGTVEGYPAYEDVLAALEEDGISKVILMPFMVVAGDHANNDMAGDEEDSWKTMLKKEGFEVETYIHGIGENVEFQQMYVDHVAEAMTGEHE
jgi:sirohydrochlorin cobaltochelatase